MQEAMLYEKIARNRVRCHLCAHYCVIADDRKGACRVRENRGSVLYTLVYGRTISQNVDPVEKKPLYHFYPGSSAYSIATPGCNFRCQWCQNWQISQMPRERDLIAGREATPKQIVASALETGSRSIAYTYTEPTIFFEYAYDTARLAHQAGLANIFVTNGYMTQEMLEMFHPFLDAANVDLKAFRKETYRRYVGAGLQPILDNLKLMKKFGIWLEVTTLVIPDLNDDPSELRDVACFIAQELGADTPWHISRFYPAYKMNNVQPTPLATLQRARQIGLEQGLHYVYVGNIPSDSGQDTFCPECGRLLIQRHGFGALINRVEKDGCPACGTPIAGVGLRGN
ncbi:MAG: AmmeMemoRadiSam system radical SAM enzyme [Anaerolineales bacterium]|jgi:pyruvate formate lyase activating enzyme